MSDKEILLSTDKICKEFTKSDGTKFTACKDVSLNLYRGETLGLVGESGCGKSTFVRTIMGLHPASSGKILSVNEQSRSTRWMISINNADPSSVAT